MKSSPATMSSAQDANVTQRPMLTAGQRAVHYSFNPQQLTHVKDIKEQSAKLIDMFIGLAEQSSDGEIKARYKLAQRSVEEACMRAVGAATYHLV